MDFCGLTPKYIGLPDQDEALPIGYSQTISAPHMHAAALELLQDKLHPGAVALDVGSGAASSRKCNVSTLRTDRCGMTHDKPLLAVHPAICTMTGAQVVLQRI